MNRKENGKRMVKRETKLNDWNFFFIWLNGIGNSSILSSTAYIVCRLARAISVNGWSVRACIGAFRNSQAGSKQKICCGRHFWLPLKIFHPKMRQPNRNARIFPQPVDWNSKQKNLCSKCCKKKKTDSSYCHFFSTNRNQTTIETIWAFDFKRKPLYIELISRPRPSYYSTLAHFYFYTTRTNLILCNFKLLSVL